MGTILPSPQDTLAYSMLTCLKQPALSESALQGPMHKQDGHSSHRNNMFLKSVYNQRQHQLPALRYTVFLSIF